MSWFAKWIHLECQNSAAMFRKDAIEAIVCVGDVTEVHLRNGNIVRLRGKSHAETSAMFARITGEL